jgi:hypothetical protein
MSRGSRATLADGIPLKRSQLKAARKCGARIRGGHHGLVPGLADPAGRTLKPEHLRQRLLRLYRIPQPCPAADQPTR